MFVPRSVRVESKDACGSKKTSDRPSLIRKVPSVENERVRQSDHEDDSDDEEEAVLSYSKQQRWPVGDEQRCVVCGRYGAYIVDQTDQDVCSLECKARHLHLLGRDDRAAVGSGHCEETGMSEAQVEQLRKELLISVKGSNVPKPITKLQDLKISDTLLANLHEAGYASLTPVQMQAVPAVLSKRDVVLSAATGSGKTLSFLLPLVMLMEGTAAARPLEPQALVLCPTRELCMQIETQAKQLMKGLQSMKTALLVGGLPIANQLYRISRGVQLLIATPARLCDIIENQSHGLDWATIHTLVVDEVDSLLHMGFETQVRKVEEKLSRDHSTIMCSATIPPHIELLAREMTTNAIFISTGTPGAPCDSVRHTVLWVEERAKKKTLFSFLTDTELFKPPAVVFVTSKMGTVLLADAINKCCDGVTSIALHGDMTQERRSMILREFLEGRHSVIVATGILARGLDLINVEQVFNFDMPTSIAEFIHQVGRAGRLGSPGWAVTFINNDNKGLFPGLVGTLEPLGVQLPSQLIHFKKLRREKQQKQAETQTQAHKRKRASQNKDSLLSLIQSVSKKRKKTD